MKITVRRAEEKDIPTWNEWTYAIRDINLFDPSIMQYPTTRVLAADDDNGPVLYMPFHPVICLESLAPRPGLSARKEAFTLFKMMEYFSKLAQDSGIGEIVFIAKDDRVADIAARHGFEEVQNVRFMRLKPANLK